MKHGKNLRRPPLPSLGPDEKTDFVPFLNGYVLLLGKGLSTSYLGNNNGRRIFTPGTLE